MPHHLRSADSGGWNSRRVQHDLAHVLLSRVQGDDDRVYVETAAIARENLDFAGLGERVDVVGGDTLDVLPKLSTHMRAE